LTAESPKLPERPKAVYHTHPVCCFCKHTAFVVGFITPPVDRKTACKYRLRNVEEQNGMACAGGLSGTG